MESEDEARHDTAQEPDKGTRHETDIRARYDIGTRARDDTDTRATHNTDIRVKDNTDTTATDSRRHRALTASEATDMHIETDRQQQHRKLMRPFRASRNSLLQKGRILGLSSIRVPNELFLHEALKGLSREENKKKKIFLTVASARRRCTVLLHKVLNE